MRQRNFKALGADPLARLRRLRGDTLPEPTEINKAARTVYATREGKLLFDWMLSQSYGKTAPPDASDSALREIEVRKRFFDQILALAEEPRESASKPKGTAS